jgi:hypothetical protein
MSDRNKRSRGNSQERVKFHQDWWGRWAYYPQPYVYYEKQRNGKHTWPPARKPVGTTLPHKLVKRYPPDKPDIPEFEDRDVQCTTKVDAYGDTVTDEEGKPVQEVMMSFSLWENRSFWKPGDNGEDPAGYPPHEPKLLTPPEDNVVKMPLRVATTVCSTLQFGCGVQAIDPQDQEEEADDGCFWDDMSKCDFRPNPLDVREEVFGDVLDDAFDLVKLAYQLYMAELGYCRAFRTTRYFGLCRAGTIELRNKDDDHIEFLVAAHGKKREQFQTARDRLRAVITAKVVDMAKSDLGKAIRLYRTLGWLNCETPSDYVEGDMIHEDFESLFDLVAEALASALRGKSRNEVKKMLGTEHDLTPAEIARFKTQWMKEKGVNNPSKWVPEDSEIWS